MVRQKGQDIGGGKKKARRPRGQKEQRRCRDKAGGADSSRSGKTL